MGFSVFPINKLRNARALKRIFIFLLLSLLPSVALRAQFYGIRNYNAENGLPSPEVYGTLQDSKGFMWFATDMGASRYNGYEFKNFSTENGLPDNSLFGFCEDKKGRIWFRSFSGKLAFFLNDSVHTLPCNPVLEKEVKKMAVILVSIHVDEADTVWIGTTDKLILKVAPPWTSGNVSWIHIPDDGGYIYLLSDNALVFGGNTTSRCRMHVYEKSLKKIVSADADNDPIMKLRHRYFATRLSNGTFLASANQTILNFDKGGIISSSRQNATVIALQEDKDGNIISASYDGIRIHKAKQLDKYETIPDFYDKSFTGIVLDRENSLWVTSEGHGVYYIPFRNNRYYTAEHGLPQSKISCIAQKNGTIYTGHLNGTVTAIKGNMVKPTCFYSEKIASISSNRINTLYLHNYSNLYAANGFTIFKINTDLNNYTEFKRSGAKLIIKSLKPNFVWVLQDRHIFYADITKDFRLEKEIRFNQYVDNIFEDSKGVLWLGALNGLWKYEKDSLEYLGDANPLLATRIIDIKEDRQGRLWMASRGKGLIIKDGQKFYNINQKDGLASNMCRNLLVDSAGQIWVGSNNGLSKIEPVKGIGFSFTTDIYSKKHGLLSNEVNFIVPQGKQLLLAHNNGISVFNPALLKNNAEPPPVYITEASINKQIYKADSLKINYTQNYLHINYVGLSYKNPGKLEYKYRMEGLDTSWVYTSYTSAQFQTLDPGDYRFTIYARNDDGYWSSTPAVLYLSILPVWWQTWTFRILAFAAAFYLVYFFIKRRISRLQKREREKAELQSKVAATELKALRAQMNPHFVFNAINSVQHFITSNDPDSSQRYLSKFAKLIRYVVDNSKPTAIPLEKELEAITLFLDLEALRFENKFEYKILVDPKIDVNFVHIPSMLIQPYIENSIWHGIMHKKEAGRIDIKIEQMENVLKCSVEDNGIGRKRSQEYKNSQPLKTHKSVGMAITRERLEIINQVNKSELSVSVTDLTDKKGEGCGTRVELFIPLY